MPEQTLTKIKDDFNKLLEVIGVKAPDNSMRAAKIFLALTKNKRSMERELVALSLLCFEQALNGHYEDKINTGNLIAGDYCYAQGILQATRTRDLKYVDTLSSTIADYVTQNKDGFLSLEEAASYLAGYNLGKIDLESYRLIGRYVKDGNMELAQKQLSNLGHEEGALKSFE